MDIYRKHLLMNDSKYTIHVQRVNYRMKVSHVYRINYHIHINVIYVHGVNKNEEVGLWNER